MAKLTYRADKSKYIADILTISTLCEAKTTMGNAGKVNFEDLLIRQDKIKTKIKPPPFFKVIMLNDDYTPMDFVVQVLENIFHKTHAQAVEIMLDIHQKNSAICGVFTRDVAETKIDMVIAFARTNEYPLRCVMEEK